MLGNQDCAWTDRKKPKNLRIFHIYDLCFHHYHFQGLTIFHPEERKLVISLFPVDLISHNKNLDFHSNKV